MKQLFLLIYLAISLFSASFDDAVLEAKKSNKLLLIELEMEFCPYCEKMEKYVLSKEDVKDYIQKNYVFLKLDIHKDSLPDIFTSRVTPTFYFLKSDGEKVLKEIIGAPSKSQFMTYLREISEQEKR